MAYLCVLYNVCYSYKFEFIIILCRNILKVFVRLDIDLIPDYFSLSRWKQEANKFRIMDSQYLGQDDGVQESETLRLTHMCQQATKLTCIAASSNETYMIYMDAINELSKKLSEVSKHALLTSQKEMIQILIHKPMVCCF